MITVMKIKYPRTFHFAFSQGVASDDKIIKSTSAFIGQRVIVSSKMDGENTNLYHDYIHARSLESANHISQEWVKNWHGSFKHEIPTNLRIAGENLYACHSIFYDDLPHYFLGFSVWDGNTCLSWDDTIEWFNLLNITPVKVLYDGIYDEQLISNLYKSMNLEKQEANFTFYKLKFAREPNQLRIPNTPANKATNKLINANERKSVPVNPLVRPRIQVKNMNSARLTPKTR